MNVVEGLQVEIDRCQELLGHYEAIPTGWFGAGMLRKDIDSAKNAIASGDAVEMLKTLEKLKQHDR